MVDFDRKEYDDARARGEAALSSLKETVYTFFKEANGSYMPAGKLRELIGTILRHVPSPVRAMLVRYSAKTISTPLVPENMYDDIHEGLYMLKSGGRDPVDAWNVLTQGAEVVKDQFDKLTAQVKLFDPFSGDFERAVPKPVGRDGAIMGKYAWAPDRDDVPLEKNTEVEDELFDAIVNHFKGNFPMPDAMAQKLKTFLASGMYSDVVKEPSTPTVFRGVQLGRAQFIKLTGMSADDMSRLASSFDNDDYGKMFVTIAAADLKVQTWKPRARSMNTSWTTRQAVAVDFAEASIKYLSSFSEEDEIWPVVALAEVDDNPNTFLVGDEGLYKLRSVGRLYTHEHEVLALGPVKLSAIRVYKPVVEKKATETQTTKEHIMKITTNKVKRIVQKALLPECAYVLNEREAQLPCHGDIDESSMRLVVEGDVVHDLGETRFRPGDGEDVEYRRVRLDEGFVGWVPWSDSFTMIEGLNEAPETRDPWVVRSGETVLVRRSDGPRDSWKPHTLKKVTYFTDDELTGPPNPQPIGYRTFVFERDGWRCAVREEQFFTKPE